MKLTIAIPTSNSILPQTMMSVFSAVHRLDMPVRLDVIQSCYVHDARNKLVDRAIETGCSHLLFVDSDMSFEQDGVQKLFMHKVAVVGGLYYRREDGNIPTILMEQGEKLVVPETVPDKPFEVFATGTGFMLIDLEKIKDVQFPYFWFGFFKERMLGEDAWFCHQVKKAGLPVWCDPTVEVKHWGLKAY